MCLSSLLTSRVSDLRCVSLSIITRDGSPGDGQRFLRAGAIWQTAVSLLLCFTSGSCVTRVWKVNRCISPTERVHVTALYMFYDLQESQRLTALTDSTHRGLSGRLSLLNNPDLYSTWWGEISHITLLIFLCFIYDHIMKSKSEGASRCHRRTLNIWRLWKGKKEMIL